VKLEALIKQILPIGVAGALNHDVLGVACDSRQVTPNSIFVAVSGQNQDGSSYIEDAVERGAVAVVSEREGRITRRDICVIRVADARKALAQLSCVLYGNPSKKLQIAGITGTNGKTTTAYMLRNMLLDHGSKPGLIGTVEYEIGARIIPARRTTPEAPLLQSMLAQMVIAGCKSAVMEVSSHALDQKRVFGIDYDVAVFTNLTRDHLDYHKTMEKYFEAKSLLFLELGKLEKCATAIINVDDPWGLKLSGMSIKADVLSYGLGSNAMVRAQDIQLQHEGSTFRAITPWGGAEIRTRMMGRFNVYNALAAIAAGGALGIKLDTMIRQLSEMVCVTGRLEEIPTGKGFQVFVDYAHTDDALENVLKTLQEITPKRLLLVFGCGGNRDKTKRPLMGKVASRLADYSIITSDNPRNEDPAQIIREIKEGFGDSTGFEVCEDRAEAIGRVVGMAKQGDVVLIAGKGHENFQEIANTTIAFDDRQVVKRYL
jgi:UDP-N-acetylmuramoyl-L-alanyl-D-glutamate--2,6-diaminopimelate ligase